MLCSLGQESAILGPTRDSRTRLYRLHSCKWVILSMPHSTLQVPLTPFVVEDMDQLVRAHATCRFILCNEEGQKPRLLVRLEHAGSHWDAHTDPHSSGYSSQACQRPVPLPRIPQLRESALSMVLRSSLRLLDLEGPSVRLENVHPLSSVLSSRL